MNPFYSSPMRMRGINEQFRSGLRKGLIGIGIVMLTGVTGYRLIEGWSWADCFYMTVITVSTVGYGEVHALSGAGRTLTILLIFIGVGLMAYCLTHLVEFLFQRSITNVLGRKIMLNKITKLKQHAIICGYGRTGARVVAELQAANKPFVVIEENEDIIKRLDEQNIPYIVGNATEEEILEAANVY